MQQMLSQVFPEAANSPLQGDPCLFRDLGQARTACLKAYARFLKSRSPDFGHGCLVDTAPLSNMPGCQGRLAIVLDKATGRPAWFSLFAGKIGDATTLECLLQDAQTSVGITVDTLVLDAGHVSGDVLGKLLEDKTKNFIGKLPKSRDFHHDTLFRELVLPNIAILKGHQFFRDGHSYFGKRTRRKFFGHELFVCAYVNKQKAAAGNLKFHEQNADKLHELGEEELEWIAYRDGYFALLTTIDATPAEIFDMYVSKTEIESQFKTKKGYADCFPADQQDFDTVNGKILFDLMCTNIFLDIKSSTKDCGLSIANMFSALQSLCCCRSSDDILKVDTPTNVVRDIYKLLDVGIVPGFVEISKLRRDLGLT